MPLNKSNQTNHSNSFGHVLASQTVNNKFDHTWFSANGFSFSNWKYVLIWMSNSTQLENREIKKNILRWDSEFRPIDKPIE